MPKLKLPCLIDFLLEQGLLILTAARVKHECAIVYPTAVGYFYEAQAFIYIIIINTLSNYILEISNTIAFASCIKYDVSNYQHSHVNPTDQWILVDKFNTRMYVVTSEAKQIYKFELFRSQWFHWTYCFNLFFCISI